MKKLEPILPTIMKKTSNVVLFETTDAGIKIDDNSNPQNIKSLLWLLSAKNPKIGCNSEENICETVSITVAIAIDIPIFAAINGIIGFNTPVYMSFIKCPPLNQTKAFLFWDKLFSIREFKFKINKKSMRQNYNFVE